MFMKNFKLKFEQNWPKPLLITTFRSTHPDNPHFTFSRPTQVP